MFYEPGNSRRSSLLPVPGEAFRPVTSSDLVLASSPGVPATLQVERTQLLGQGCPQGVLR